MTNNPTNEHREAREIELLPCPFCGTNAFTSWDGDTNSPDDWSVNCDNTLPCGATVQGMSSEAAAIEAWNTRALSSRDTEIRQVLEGLRFRHGCWCELPPNTGSPDHVSTCNAAHTLYAKLQPGKER